MPALRHMVLTASWLAVWLAIPAQAAPDELTFCDRDRLFADGFQSPFERRRDSHATTAPSQPVARIDAAFAAGARFSQCHAYAGPLPADGQRNAYPTAFMQPPGQPWTYLAWVWRETANVNANHTISIARSQNYSQWQNLCGDAIELPIRLHTGEVVDAVGPQGGVMNKLNLGYDRLGHAIVTYHKYVWIDGVKTTQFFNARRRSDGWQRSQMTQWTTVWELEGTGALPPGPFDVWATGVNIDRHGVMYQRFERAQADADGWPTTGDYVLDETETGDLVIVGPYQPPAVPETDFDWMAPCPSGVLLATPPPQSMATDFQVRVRASRHEDRWLAVRGDWSAPGSDEAGLYDRWMTRFFLWPQGSPQSFPFGSLAWTPGLLPLVGDWDGDGRAGIGLYSPDQDRSWLRNSLSGGPADLILPRAATAADGLHDARWLWHEWNPARRHFLRWQSLPTNHDRPYDCDGQPLPNRPVPDATALCPERFVTDLALWSFDLASGTWSQTVIDQAWAAGNPAFDLLTFRDHLLVGYYDRHRWLTVAHRQGGGPWRFHRTQSRFAGWDQHNYITLHVDAEHDLHVSGNQHFNPLVYFRSNGLDIDTLHARAMVGGALESHVTYPQFSYTPQGRLAYSFRQGGSGSGNTWIYHYDPVARTWSPLTSQPLLGGAMGLATEPDALP